MLGNPSDPASARDSAFARLAPMVAPIVGGMHLSVPGFEPEDWLQEGYLLLLRAIEAYPGESSGGMPLAPWCRRFVRTRLLDVRRWHAVWKRTLPTSCIDDPNLGYCLAYTPSERDLDLERAVRALDPFDQDLLDMRYRRGLGEGEIARALGWTRRATHDRMRVALARLRRAYLTPEELSLREGVQSRPSV